MDLEKSILLNTRTLYFSLCRNRPHWSRVPPFGSTTKMCIRDSYHGGLPEVQCKGAGQKAGQAFYPRPASEIHGADQDAGKGEAADQRGGEGRTLSDKIRKYVLPNLPYLLSLIHILFFFIGKISFQKSIGTSAVFSAWISCPLPAAFSGSPF